MMVDGCICLWISNHITICTFLPFSFLPPPHTHTQSTRHPSTAETEFSAECSDVFQGEVEEDEDEAIPSRAQTPTEASVQKSAKSKHAGESGGREGGGKRVKGGGGRGEREEGGGGRRGWTDTFIIGVLTCQMFFFSLDQATSMVAFPGLMQTSRC